MQRRRGVLLLVVLSLLGLFSLLGAAFLSTSQSFNTAARVRERAHRASLQPADLMDRALMQVLRDTNNPHSSIRYHSLLRDMYGTDGFSGRVYAPNTVQFNNTPAATAADVVPRYADANTANPLGPTQGQIIEFFIDSQTLQQGNAALAIPATEATPVQANNAGPFELELDTNGLPVGHALSPTDGYYNGSLLTFTSGPAAGQTVRVLDYDFVGDQPEFLIGGTPSAMFRVRVAAFTRSDNAQLQTNPARSLELSDLVQATSIDVDDNGLIATNGSETFLFGHSFIVSGRPFNGTGVGYNTLADISAPRLTAAEPLPITGGDPLDLTNFIEVALAPNSRYPIDNVVVDPASGTPVNFPTFVGLGGADESYDAPDFQNMALAWQPLRLRARGRVVIPNGTNPPVSVEVASAYDDPSEPPNAPLRLDLEDLPLPSFHRPALVNYWMQRLFNSPWLVSAIGDQEQRARAVLQPYGADLRPGGVGPGVDNAPPAIAAQIVAIKRKILLRPLPEDHPNFDGSNPTAAAFQQFNIAGANINQLVSGGTITFPFWEATGPWDVDNDNDGVADSIWVDLGMPVQTTEDGRFYKPLFAILVQDLDGRLNLNAHGSSDHLVATNLDPTPAGVSNLASGVLSSSDDLPPGSGWGPGDISLRSVLFPELPTRPDDGVPATPDVSNLGDITWDDYARLLFGRSTESTTASSQLSIPGRYGSIDTMKQPNLYGDGSIDDPNEARNLTIRVAAGIAQPPGIRNPLDTVSAFEFFGHPSLLADVFPSRNTTATLSLSSGFGALPDFRSRYATALDPFGQPVQEAANDGSLTQVFSDSVYELNLGRFGRRGSLPARIEQEIINQGTASATSSVFQINDDAPFSIAELERLVRAFDADAGRLPDRLWELVDAFDPDKLAFQETGSATPNSLQLVTAQIQAERNRRSVTTDSFDVPATNEHWIDRLRFGADGLPGPQNGNPSDDYLDVIGEPVPAQPRLMDYLRYRVALELQRQGAPVNEATISQIIRGDNNAAVGTTQRRASFGGLLAPEVLAGLKMDLNRPFGDGRDNNGNGTVDEPQEAGEPWIDVDGNGVFDNEPFLDLDGDGRFFADLDGNGVFNPNSPAAGDLTPNGEPIVDTLFQQQLGRAIPFDHANSQDATGRGAFVDDSSGTPGVYDAGEPIIRDDSRMARQLYARHLYCLMLLLTDENYLTPIDPNDAQVRHYVDPNSNGSPANQIRNALNAAGFSGDANLEAERRARRKLTLRQIAQWAINVVDARDPDVIQTPFEYDENPWDGWNVVNTSSGAVFPLDGDLATDENGTQVRPVTTGGFGAPTPAMPLSTTDPGGVPATDQTRGVVWGAERPELLINEGLALHDRRQEDLQFEMNEAGQEDVRTGDPAPSGGMEDNTLDQRLLPTGWAFVEVYNPNGPDSQLPAELYRDELANRRVVDVDKNGTPETPVDGVLFDKLSNGSLAGERSPVWRLITIEEHPRLRNEDPIDNGSAGVTSNTNTRSWQGTPSAYRQMFDWAGGVTPHLIDPDFPTFDASYRPTASINGTPNNSGLLLTIEDRPAYIEREAYPVAGRRRPMRTLQVTGLDTALRGSGGIVGGGVGATIDPATGGVIEPAAAFGLERVGANTLLVQSLPPEDIADPNDDGDPSDRRRFAPILPGHYGVIGSAGFDYPRSTATPDFDDNGEFNRRYISPIGRLETARAPGSVGAGGVGPGGAGIVVGPPDPAGGVANSQLDAGHEPGVTRRIELVPNPNPFVHQVLVGDNGGPEYDVLGPRTTAPGDDRVVNVTDPTRPADTNTAGNQQSLREFNEDDIDIKPSFFNNNDGALSDFEINPNDTAPDGDAARYQIKPAVAFPLEGFTMSPRVDNYFGRYAAILNQTGSDFNARRFNTIFANAEGAFVNPAGTTANTPNPFTTPFDTEQEMQGNRTTPSYRTIHLQRLANPLLVWNPRPGQPDHEPNLPVNPYLTVDSMAVDMTAFNGTAVDNALAGTPGPGNPGLGGNPLAPGAGLGPGTGGLDMTLASNQRGDRQTVGAMGQQNANAPVAPRVLWRQERRASRTDLLTQPGVIRQNDRINPAAIPGITPFYGQRLEASARPDPHYADFALRHSLGYANVRFERDGNAFVRQEELFTADIDNDGTLDPEDVTYNRNLNGDNQPGDLIGAPTITPGGDTQDDATYPWLTWNNRPFISAHELLQVPAASASAMLRDFSTYNAVSGGNNAVNPNPYDGDALVDNTNNRVPDFAAAEAAATNNARRAAQQAPFGHLLNFFQSATRVAAAQEVNSELVSAGAPNFHRLLDYVHVPSRFVGTDQLANPVVFNPLGVNPGAPNDDVLPGDARAGLLAPFNRLSEYREPGRVNLNTVVGSRTSGLPLSASSPVYDGIMHRLNDLNPVGSLGHRGPAWRDVVVSRRGYVDPNIVSLTSGQDTSAATLNPNVPTLFGNPFRASDEGDFVPLASMRRIGAESSLLRSHPWSPGADGVWGATGDDNSDTVIDDTSEAGLGGSDVLMFNTNDPLGTPMPTVTTSGGVPIASGTAVPVTETQLQVSGTSTPLPTRVPLFSAGDREASLDAERNSALRYGPLTRLSNLVTTRSGVYAVWITVGFFEVEPAPPFATVQAQFLNNRALYDRVYPDGYQLGAELGSETGDTQRFRSFYIIDRTLPVGFQPGENLNAENTIRLRRRIE